MTESFVGVGPHFLYFVLALGVLAAFTRIYLGSTPHDELALIRSGNVAAAIVLGGALLGFSLVLARAVAQSVGLVDFAIWSAVAMVSQLVAFQVFRRAWPELLSDIQQDRVASGVVVGVVSVCVGMLNAAAMTL